MKKHKKLEEEITNHGVVIDKVSCFVFSILKPYKTSSMYEVITTKDYEPHSALTLLRMARTVTERPSVVNA